MVPVGIIGDDPLWFKDAIIYQLHVRAYCDSNGDGVGDFRGLAEKLDYLHDLGVTALWILPFYPSPLRDDGYDISGYTDIHPTYGTMADFKLFLREAHRRGLSVVTELVMNHTSDQHPWFQKARRAKPGTRTRDFYVWSNAPEKYRDARIIFKDFEASNWTWDSVAKSYFWHRFYSHQPDLNFDNPAVRKAMFQALDYWLGAGIDVLRLDAVPYLYEREGTNCENLPETHAFLKDLRRHVDKKFKNRMVLAEANQWPEDAAAYFGSGDECHMAFHFPIMPRMFMAIHMEDRFPIIDILNQTPAIHETCQWAIFLRNHDELTLEMVTDEERDYMYRVYAHDPQARVNLGIRRRLGPLLGNHRRKVELMNGLLFSLPGTPVIYYGDEIGMGDNIYLGDRNGVRTPMQWSADRNAGFSRANPQRLYLPVIIDPEYHFQTINVEAQQNNPHSLLWWMKRLIALRKRFKAFGRGSIEFLYPENHKVLAYVRRYQDEIILVVANLSRFVQYVELDLSLFKGMMPVEMFGRTEFPLIGDLPYLLTLGPHAFFWFALEPQRAAVAVESVKEFLLPEIDLTGGWEGVVAEKARPALENVLPRYLRDRRWFGGKARKIKQTKIVDAVQVPGDQWPVYVTFVRVEYTEGEPETYLLPLTFAAGESGQAVTKSAPHSVLAQLRIRNDSGVSEGILYDALASQAFATGLLDAIGRRRRFRDSTGELIALPTRVFRAVRGPLEDRLETAPLKAEQSNTSVVYGDRLILKLFRRLEEGVNPDLEIGRVITERTGFSNIPPVAGYLEFRKNRGEPITLGILQGFVQNQGDAWKYTLDQVESYFERVLASRIGNQEIHLPRKTLLDLTEETPSQNVFDAVGGYLESARLLGRRTAELHVALASVSDDPNFAPEPFSALYQRSLYQSMRTLSSQVFLLLRKRLRLIPAAALDEAQQVLGLEEKVSQSFKSILNRKITAMRIRCHGDYHLGQVLYTGKDFIIIDFEGEVARSLSERRIKRSPLRDVAGLLRSYDYASHTAIAQLLARGAIAPDGLSLAEMWGRFWYRWVCSAFLKSYLEEASKGSFLPQAREELEVLLNTYLLEKAVYELGYELNNRPDWVKIPLHGILSLLKMR